MSLSSRKRTLSGTSAQGMYRNDDVQAELKNNERIKELEKLKLEEMVQEGEKKEDIALLILKTPELLKRLGRYDHEALFWAAEKGARYGQTLSEEREAELSGKYIVRIAANHVKAIDYVKSNLSDYISSGSLNGLLQKSCPPRLMGGYGGCGV